MPRVTPPACPWPSLRSNRVSNGVPLFAAAVVTIESGVTARTAPREGGGCEQVRSLKRTRTECQKNGRDNNSVISVHYQKATTLIATGQLASAEWREGARVHARVVDTSARSFRDTATIYDKSCFGRITEEEISIQAGTHCRGIPSRWARSGTKALHASNFGAV